MLIKANYHRGKRPTEKGQNAHWAYCPKPKWAFCPRATCHTFCSVASSPCIAFLHQVAQIHFKAICFMLGMVFHGHQILTCLRHQLLSSKNYKKMVKKHKYSPTAENSAYNSMNSGDITKTGIAICLVLEKCCYLSQGGSKGQWAFCPRWASCPMLLYVWVA